MKNLSLQSRLEIEILEQQMMSSSLPVPCVDRGPLLLYCPHRRYGRYSYGTSTMSQNGAPVVADA